jgi:N-acetylneuraminic acid mutarotase
MATLIVLLLAAAGQPAGGAPSGGWGSTTSYPLSLDDESCVTSGVYIYCIGGFTGDTYTADGSQSTSAAYFALLSPRGGISSWENTASYPTIVNTESCSAYNGDVYCIGGYTGSGATDSVYYAALSSTGVSQWNQTANYPENVFSQSCSVWEGYIYCVGGYLPSGLPTNSVYYARLSSSGVTAWNAGASYPTNITSQSCVPAGGYLYCVGGIDDENPAVTNAVYSAALTPSGLSAWTETSSYPTSVDIQSCVASDGSIYCIGGASNFAATDSVYYATVDPSGLLSAWASAVSYPAVIGEQSCIASSGLIYCIGGAHSAAEHTESVYYAEDSALATVPPMSSSAITSSQTAYTPTTSSKVSGSSTTASTSLSISWSYAVVFAINAVLLILLASSRGRSTLNPFEKDARIDIRNRENHRVSWWWSTRSLATTAENGNIPRTRDS